MEAKKKKFKVNWVIKISIFTFIMAFMMSTMSETSLSKTPLVISFFVVIFIVFFGVVFDVIGIAVAAADEKPFHAMAAQKNKSAKYGILLIKNASVVANFCNDVVGDIAGIVSGSAVTSIAFQIIQATGGEKISVMNIILSSSVAALTVGGKAVGKEYGIKKSKSIVMFVSKLICRVDETLKLKLLNR